MSERATFGLPSAIAPVAVKLSLVVPTSLGAVAFGAATVVVGGFVVILLPVLGLISPGCGTPF